MQYGCIFRNLLLRLSNTDRSKRLIFFFEKTLRFHVKYLWRGGGHRVNKWLSADLPAWISGNLSFKYVLLIPKFDPNPFYFFLTFCSRRRIFFHAIMTAVPTDRLSRKIYTKASCWDNFEGCCWYFWPWTEDVLLIAIDPNPFYVFLSYEIVIYLQFKARNKYQQPSKWSQRSLCL